MVDHRLPGQLQRRRLHRFGTGRSVRIHAALEHERQRRPVLEVNTPPPSVLVYLSTWLGVHFRLAVAGQKEWDKEQSAHYFPF